MRNWQPAEDGEYDAQHSTDSCVIEGEWITVREGVVGSDDMEEATIALPDDLRMFRLLPEESITADALERDGWKEKESEAGIVVMARYIRRFDYDLTVSLYIDRCGDETPEVTFAGVDYAGCTTMRLLRELEMMLEGGEN